MTSYLELESSQPARLLSSAGAASPECPGFDTLRDTNSKSSLTGTITTLEPAEPRHWHDDARPTRSESQWTPRAWRTSAAGMVGPGQFILATLGGSHVQPDSTEVARAGWPAGDSESGVLRRLMMWAKGPLTTSPELSFLSCFVLFLESSFRVMTQAHCMQRRPAFFLSEAAARPVSSSRERAP